MIRNFLSNKAPQYRTLRKYFLLAILPLIPINLIPLPFTVKATVLYIGSFVVFLSIAVYGEYLIKLFTKAQKSPPAPLEGISMLGALLATVLALVVVNRLLVRFVPNSIAGIIVLSLLFLAGCVLLISIHLGNRADS